MTAPNVGKVTLEASVKTDNLRNKLTRDISDKVLPQLKGLFDEIRKINKEIGDVRSTPFEQMAKQAGVASKQAEAVARATDRAKDKEIAFQRAVNAGNSIATQRDRALKRINDELAKTGKVSKLTQQAFDDLDRKVDTALEDIIRKEAKWKGAQEEILRAGARAHDDYVRRVEAFRDSQIKSLDDVLAHTKATVNKVIAEAVKQTDKQIDEAYRHNDAMDRERDREAAAAERHRRREEERDAASAARRERREASSQRARARLVQRGLKSPVAVVGEIGRALSGFAPRLSTGAFSTIAAGVLLIAGAASSATQALWLLPAAATAAGTAMAALTIGTAGFGDTIKALIDGDLDKFDHLVNQLSGNAQQLALHIQQILPVFEGFKNKIQDALFVDTVPLMRGLVQSYLPIIEQLLASVAGSFNKYMRNLGAELLTPQVRDTIGLISQNIMGFFNQLTPIVKPLLQAFLDIAKVGSDLLPGMARGAVGLAQSFADFIRRARETGKLRDWLKRGLETVRQLAKLAWEIGRAFLSLAPVAEQILPYIVDLFKTMADYLSANNHAIYTFIGLLAGVAAIKTIGTLLINLGLLAQGFGKTLPQAVRDFGNKARGVFGIAARDAAVMSANTERAARDIAKLTTSTNAMSASSKAALASAGAPALSTMIAGRFRSAAEGPLGAAGRAAYSRRELDIAGRATALRDSMVNSARSALTSVASIGTTTTTAVRNAVSATNTAVMTLPLTAIRAAEGAKRGLKGIDQALGNAVYSIRDRGRQAVGAVSDAASNAAPKVGGFLKAVGGILSLIGLGTLIDDIVETNAKSDAAMKNLQQDIIDARDRGMELHDAFLQSKGVLDATTADALNASLKEAVDHMHNLGQSQASWLDKFRGTDGGFSFGQTAKWLTGSIDEGDLLKVPVVGNLLSWLRGGAGTNKFDAEKAKGQPFRDAEKLLQDRFGSDLTGLDQVVSGDQGTFDALLETFRKSGDAGKIAIDMLQKVRTQVTGLSTEAQQVGPLFEKLGPDIAKSFQDLKINIDALPKDVPIKLNDKGAKAVMEAFDKWGQKVTSDPITGELKINGDIIPEVAKALEALDVQIKKLPTGQVIITLDDQATPGIAKLKAALQLATLPVPTGTPGAPIGGGASVPALPFPPPPPGAPAIGPNLGALPPLKPPPQLPPGGVPKPAADIPDALGNLPGDDGYIPPPADTKDARGNTIKKPSTKERREAIAATLDPKLWQVDPWSFQGSPNVTNGMMQVQLPQGIPGLNPGGMTGIPGLGFPAVNSGGTGPSLWDQVLPHEGGTWNNQDTGNNGHYGGLQFDPETWKAFGGIDLTGQSNPANATREQQIEIANRTAFTGYNGKAPQGLQAWEAITKGRVPGVTVNTPASAFMGGGGPVSAMPLMGGIQVPGSGQQLSGDSSAQQALEQIIRQNFPGVSLNFGGWRPSDGPGTPTGHQEGRALDIGIPNFNTPEGKAIGDQINAFLRANAAQLGLGSTIWQDTWKDFKGNSSTVGGHMNHVHAELAKNAMMGAPFGTAMSNGAFPNIALGNGMEVDPRAILEKQQNIQRQAFDLEQSKRKLAILEHDDLATQQELMEARQKVVEDEQDLQKAQMDLIEAQTGKQSKPMDYSKLPFGDPRKILAGAITGAGGSDEDVAALVGGMLGAPASAIGAFAGDTAASALTGLSPKFGGPGGPGVYSLGTPTAPNANLNQLVQERNPMAFASMAGFQVPDYTRQGGGADAQNLTLNGGPPNDATGRIYTDTAALIDRTFTNLDAAEKARFDQMLSVATQTKDRLATDALGPVIKESVTAGLTEAASAIGTKIGEAAAPAIADAVRSAIPSGGGGGQGGEGAQLVNTGAGALNGVLAGAFADGGATYGGIPGRDSIPALLMPGEHVLTTADVARMGGQSAVYAFRQALARTGGVRGFATGGGVNVNDTVGAEFFGVSQVPIIGAIVNLLVRVLLKVLGVNIEARDTLDEMSKDFRQFRGDFQAFDATGRLMNDTSGLLDRSSTGEETAAAERIRILKIVIEALIKFIIEKLIAPIGKAIANSLINAGAGAAGGAISASFPGGSIVGGVASSVISSAGTAVVDIVADILQTFATSLFSVLIDVVGEVLHSYFPDLVTGLFGGGLLEGLFSPISALLTGLLSPVLGLFGAVGSLGSFLPFDSGGVAIGKGWLPKNTMDPEMVLSPQETSDFPNLVKAVQALAGNRRDGNVTMHATFQVASGGEEAARRAYDELTRLIT